MTSPPSRVRSHCSHVHHGQDVPRAVALPRTARYDIIAHRLNADPSKYPPPIPAGKERARGERGKTSRQRAGRRVAAPTTTTPRTRTPETRRMYVLRGMHDDGGHVTTSIKLPADHLPEIAQAAESITDTMITTQETPAQTASAACVAAVSAPGRNRTCDTRFRKPLLYPLSYEGSEVVFAQLSGRVTPAPTRPGHLVQRNLCRTCPASSDQPSRPDA